MSKTGTRSAATAGMAACLVMTLALALAQTAWAADVPAGPHAALLSSRLGCLSCHTAPGDLYGSLGGDDGALGPVSDDACLACHTGGGPAPQVYAGSAANYRARRGLGHDDPSKVSCIDCHSIHGPVLENPHGITGKLLKRLDYQPEAVAAHDPNTSAHDEALSVWCTGCHDRWPTDARPDAAFLTGEHPMAPADGVRAFRDATSCRSCHAAGGPSGIGPGDFPHFTPGAASMLVGAASADGTVSGVAKADADGVCLRCHRADRGGIVVGVGLTY
jgi:hypothetical protein